MSADMRHGDRLGGDKPRRRLDRTAGMYERASRRRFLALSAAFCLRVEEWTVCVFYFFRDDHETELSCESFFLSA